MGALYICIHLFYMSIPFCNKDLLIKFAIFSQSFFNNMNVNFFIMLLGLLSFALILISGALRIYSTYKINKFMEILGTIYL